MVASVANIESMQPEEATAPEVIVRTAGATDLLRVLALVRDWHQSAGSMFPAPVEADALSWILQTEKTGRIFLAELNGGRYKQTLAGCLMTYVSTLPWNHHHHTITDSFFYVPAAYRRWGVPSALVESAQAAAAAFNAPLILTLFSGPKAGRTEKYYGISGGHQVGATFAYGIEDS